MITFYFLQTRILQESYLIFALVHQILMTRNVKCRSKNNNTNNNNNNNIKMASTQAINLMFFGNKKNKNYLFCGICNPLDILYLYIIIISLQFSYIEDLFSIQIPSQSPLMNIAFELAIASNASTSGNILIKGWYSKELSTRSSPPSLSKKSF